MIYTNWVDLKYRRIINTSNIKTSFVTIAVTRVLVFRLSIMGRRIRDTRCLRHPNNIRVTSSSLPTIHVKRVMGRSWASNHLTSLRDDLSTRSRKTRSKSWNTSRMSTSFLRETVSNSTSSNSSKRSTSARSSTRMLRLTRRTNRLAKSPVTSPWTSLMILCLTAVPIRSSQDSSKIGWDLARRAVSCQGFTRRSWLFQTPSSSTYATTRTETTSSKSF